jgi:hypothetical protein
MKVIAIEEQINLISKTLDFSTGNLKLVGIPHIVARDSQQKRPIIDIVNRLKSLIRVNFLYYIR